MPFNNQNVTKEIKERIKKYLEINDNDNTNQNLWDAVKAVLRGFFFSFSIKADLKKQKIIK